MFRNYFAVALRNLVRNRLYAAINVIGLAVGLCAAILIGLFVRDEFSYDTWLLGHKRTYLVTSREIYSTTKPALDAAPSAAAEYLKQEFPEIEAITRFAPSNNETTNLRRGDLEYTEKLQWADPNIFDVLPLRAVAGDLATALQAPDSIVLTRAMARKYFGRDNVLGETLEVDRKAVFRVTAVLEDLPSNTHLDFSAIASNLSPLSNSAFHEPRPPVTFCVIYLRLAPGASAEVLRRALPAVTDRHPEFNQVNATWTRDIVPIDAVHFSPPAVAALKPRGDRAVALGASAIALLIVAIAAINFINLTTARALRRAVEVGVRKASGAFRRHLILQFIIESVIYAVLGVVAAIVAAYAMLPAFNDFLDRRITFDLTRDWAAPILAALGVGVLAGAYPAIYLARLPAAAVLKGARPASGAKARQALVAFQFAILIVLALAATTVYRQAVYGVTTALRFDTDQMLMIENACNTPFEQGVRALPGVRGAACSAGTLLTRSGPVFVTGAEGKASSPGRYSVDYDLLALYGIKPVAGRFFSRDFGADAVPESQRAVPPAQRTVPPAVVINETAAHELGFATPEGAVGATIRWQQSRFNGAGESQVIGVAPDFVRAGIHEALSPAIFWVDPVLPRMLSVKLSGADVPETLIAIDRLWKEKGPPRPIARTFADQQVEALYRDVVRLSEIVGVFAAVAVFISCLGLFGLAAFTAESRTNEIGVRKALGASPRDILQLMLWEFARPILWASLIAWPVAYLIMRRWLEGFADRVDIGLWAFPAASVLALAIAGFTILGHAIVVSRAEPVAALRYE